MDQTLEPASSPVPSSPDQSVGTPAPVMSVKSKAPRIIAWVAVVVVVLAGGYVLFANHQHLWPFPWTIYTNAQYGLELKYPKNWPTPRVNTSQGSVNIGLSRPDSSSSIIQMVNVQGFVSRGSTEQNISAFLQDPAYSGTSWKQEIDLKNGKAFYFVNESLGGLEPSAYVVGPRGAWFIWAADVTTERTLLSILRTFKFTDSVNEPQVNGQTGEWRAYTNIRYGYSLQYPSTWYIISPIDSAESDFSDTLMGGLIQWSNYDYQKLDLSAESPPDLEIVSLLIHKTDLTLDAFAQQLYGKYMPTFNPTTISGAPALVITFAPSSAASRHAPIYLFKKGDAAFVFTGSTSAAGVAALNQILSTFKFTK